MSTEIKTFQQVCCSLCANYGNLWKEVLWKGNIPLFLKKWWVWGWEGGNPSKFLFLSHPMRNFVNLNMETKFSLSSYTKRWTITLRKNSIQMRKDSNIPIFRIATNNMKWITIEWGWESVAECCRLQLRMGKHETLGFTASTSRVVVVVVSPFT